VDGEYHSIGVGERSLDHILGGEGYGNMSPIGLGNLAFGSYVIYFSKIVSVLWLGTKIGI
jgi:hypothetical protein